MEYETDTTICKDMHRCDNGAKCVENPVDEGTYYCDCDIAGDENTAFAGLYCEHEATQYCSSKHRKTTFCTNGGTCVKKGTDEDKYFACDCPDGFKGANCQFSVNVPEDWPTMQLSAADVAPKSKSVLGPAAVAVISIVVIAVVGILGFFALRRYNTRKSSDVPIDQPDPSTTMAGSGDAGSSLPHPDEVRQSVAETSSPKRTRVQPKAVMEGDDIDESAMEEVNMGNDII